MAFCECADPRVAVLAQQLRNVSRRMEVIFHGTRFPRRVLMDDMLLCSRTGYRAVSFTRDPRVAAYWALLERDDDEQDGAVFVFDLQRLRARYRLEPFHDPVWDICYPQNDEAEEQVWGRDIANIHSYLVGAVWSQPTDSRDAVVSVWRKDMTK